MPSLLGQEMGHGYGLNHSRRLGSTFDYEDPWDTMSTANAYMQAHDEFTLIGPGLSAANMRARGWLDERRVWQAGPMSADEIVRLRPLHRYTLTGFLAADIPDPDSRDRRWILEFRNKPGWDGDVPASAVLIHRLDGGYSYLVPGPFPQRDYLLAGDVIERGVIENPFSAYYRIEVLAIDPMAETCDLRYVYRRGYDPFEGQIALAAGQILGRVMADGEGLIIGPNGGIVPVGPWDPTFKILEKVAVFHALEGIEDMSAREMAQKSVLQEIIDAAQLGLDGLKPTKMPVFKPGDLPPGDKKAGPTK